MTTGYWTKSYHLATTLVGDDLLRDAVKTINDARYSVVNLSGATVIKGSSGTYFGYRILGNAGAHTMDIYDNIAASGQKLEPATISVAAAADGRVNRGTRFTTGLTVNTSGDVTDSLILIYWL